MRSAEKRLTHFLPPLLGFVICIALWLNLDRHAQLLGAAWLTAGLVYGYWKANGFRRTLDFSTPRGLTPNLVLSKLEAPPPRYRVAEHWGEHIFVLRR